MVPKIKFAQKLTLICLLFKWPLEDTGCWKGKWPTPEIGEEYDYRFRVPMAILITVRGVFLLTRAGAYNNFFKKTGPVTE